MKKEYINFLLVLMMGSFLLTNCSNTQSHVVENKNSTVQKYENTAGKIDLLTYGVHSCMEPGGCEPITIEVLAYRDTGLNQLLTRPRPENVILLSHYNFKKPCQVRNDYSYFLKNKDKYTGLKKNIDLKNTECYEVTTFPGMETIALLGIQTLDEVIYAKRARRKSNPLIYTSEKQFDQRNLLKNTDIANYYKKIDSHKNLGLTRDEYFGTDENNNYGTYYCGDGGCDHVFISVLVDKSKIKNAQKDMKRLNNLIWSAEITSFNAIDNQQYCRAYQWYKYKNNINLNNTVCLTVKAYPGKEIETTFTLRKLDSVLYAIRTGGDAGGLVAGLPQIDFKKIMEDDMKKQNQLDTVKFTKPQDDSLKSNFVKKE